MTAAAPSGVVTFEFTDIEGSTRRWESDAAAMRSALLGVRAQPGPQLRVGIGRGLRGPAEYAAAC